MSEGKKYTAHEVNINPEWMHAKWKATKKCVKIKGEKIKDLAVPVWNLPVPGLDEVDITDHISDYSDASIVFEAYGRMMGSKIRPIYTATPYGLEARHMAFLAPSPDEAGLIQLHLDDYVNDGPVTILAILTSKAPCDDLSNR